MIDFRYHVISLTAVFLALAVGVVLGSGPLRTALVEELTNETDQLRQSLADAEVEVERERQEGVIGEQFVEDAAQVLIGDSLDGQSVAIIRLHDATDADVNAIRDRIVDAGANVTTNLSIERAWTEGDQATFRASFAQQVADNVLGVDATIAPERMLAHTLAQVLAPNVIPAGVESEETEIDEGLPDEQNATDRSAVLLSLLKEGNFISGAVVGEIDAIVIVAGRGPEDETLHAIESETFAQMAGILDEYVGATVVASGPDSVDDIPTAVQSSALLRGRVTTVNFALNFYGNFTVALALSSELGGESGHYGFGDGLTLFPTS